AACSTGSVFAATSYSCDASTLKLTTPSASFKIGDTVSFTITLNNNLGINNFPYNPLTDKKTFVLGANGIQVFSIAEPANFGGVLIVSQLITAPAFTKAGSYQLTPSVIFNSLNSGGGNSTY